MEARTTSTTLTAKLPILNPGEYDLWLMRIEQYFLMTDYSIWEVIKNDNKVLTKTIGIIEQPYEPTTVEEKLDRKNDMKARGTLLMELLNKDQLKFHSYQDAKLLTEAIEKRYRGNKESKRLQKLISQLEIQGKVIEQEDINLKLLRSLSSEWKTYALIWRNKAEIETISLDDLYNNLKIYEPELIGSSSTSQNPQNVVFVSSNSTNRTNNTNEAHNTAYGVSTAHTQEQIDLDDIEEMDLHWEMAMLTIRARREDLEQIDLDDIEEMDLHWEMAMLTIRARRFIKRTCMNLDINGQKISFDRLKVECFNYHKNGHFTRECRALKNQENRGREYGRKTIPVENPTENALIVQDRIGGYDWSYQYEEEHLTNFALMALKSSGNSSNSDSENLEKVEKERDELKLTLEKYQNSSKSLNTLLESQVSDKDKTGLGYKAASPEIENFVNSSKMIENQENVKSRSDKGYHVVPYLIQGITYHPNLI
nr:hypothetical protein [Tanacetum cinerariifolium]